MDHARTYSTWGVLPDEVVTRVGAELTEKQDLAAARLACKRWASSVSRAVKSLSVRGAFPDGTLSGTLSGLESLSWERGVMSPSFPKSAPKSLRDLTLLHTVPDGCLETLTNLTSLKLLHTVPGGCLETLTNLTSLTLHNEDMEVLPPAVFQLPLLESLALPGCYDVRSLGGLERLPRLTALDLTETMVLQGTIPATIRSLRFHNTPEDEYGVKLHDFAPGLATSLTSLVITECQVFDQTGGNIAPHVLDFKTLETMTSLETLVMRDCVGFGRRDVAALAGLQRLLTLDLSGTGTGDDDTYGDESELGCLADLSSLTSLKLNGTPIVRLPEDIGVLCSLTGLTGLTGLELQGLVLGGDYAEATRGAMRAALRSALPGLTNLLV
jgi:Leucine-rich repeat (LRR) protein